MKSLRLMMIFLLVSGTVARAVDTAVTSPPGSAPASAAQPTAVDSSTAVGIGSAAGTEAEETAEAAQDQPWDFAPYRVLVWIVADDPALHTPQLSKPLHDFLDRQFASVWRVEFDSAPAAVSSVAARGLADLDFDLIAAADPVIAVKRNHPDAARIRVAGDVARYVKRIESTASRVQDLEQRSTSDKAALDAILALVKNADGDALALKELWSDAATEAMLLSRGMALTLTDPEAKIITPPVGGLVVESAAQFDKIFVVSVESVQAPMRVRVVEFDTLMRVFGPVVEGTAVNRQMLVSSIGSLMVRAFAPVVRIEEAGQKNAKGLVRAGGLILSDQSPALIRPGDVLVPMLRKDDRNAKPIMIGPIPWAYLHVTAVDDSKVEMDYHAGRPVSLQGRNNKRTFRTALKVRPYHETTMIRLHARGNVDEPLIGYEIYEKDLVTPEMTFVGRTDWNGRLWLEKNDRPLRLLYVKNGGAVLARLPVVPGQTEVEVADLAGDDLRLQAEAYIRGVQNAIVDLIAIRELLAARIRMRLTQGQMKEADELLQALRAQPTNEKIAQDMGKKQSAYLKLLGSGNANQKRKIDEMFTGTRELLSKHINPKMLRDLEADFSAAQRNGGKLPAATETATASTP